MDKQLQQALEKLVQAAANDYRQFISIHHKTKQELDEQAAEFASEFSFKRGRKYLKVLCNEGEVWAFINLKNPNFLYGDILYPAGWATPALNSARGNIFEDYSVAWTGPHYLS